MKAFSKILFLFVAAIVATANAATEVSQYGIRLVFGANYTIGQFCNGDYYIVAPSGLILHGITGTNDDSTVRASVSGIDTPDRTGVTINGAMINPTPDAYPSHGFDSRLIGYTESLNVARNAGAPLSSGNPRTIPVNSSICATSSRILVSTGGHAYLNDFAVFTVLASAPPAGSFRPPYAGPDKTITHNESEIDYTKFRNLAPVSGQSAPTSAAFTRPWMHVSTDYNQSRDFTPYNNQPEYDRDKGYQVSYAYLELHQNWAAYSPAYGSTEAAVKRVAAIRYLQLGIDLTAVFKHGSYSVSGTPYPAISDNTYQHGPMVIAGLALNDTEIKYYAKASNKVSNPYTYNGPRYRFGVDDATHFLTAANVNEVMNDQFQNAGPESGRPRYTAVTGQIGLPVYNYSNGVKATDASAHFAAIYTNVRFPGQIGEALAVMLTPGGKEAWDHDAYFAWFERAYPIFRNGGSDVTPAIVAAVWDANYSTYVTPTFTRPAPVVGVGSIRPDDSGAQGKRFVVTFSDNVTITGTPVFTFTTTGGAIPLTYFGGNGTTELEFTTGRTVGNETNMYFAFNGSGIVASVGGAAVPSATNIPCVNYAYFPYETGGGGGRTVSGGGDTTPPTPNPPTISSTGHTSNSVTVTAPVATDETSLGSAPYSASKDDGITWEEFQSSRVFTWSGLSSNTAFKLRVRARDAAGNYTSPSAAVTVTTDAGTPTVYPKAKQRRNVNFNQP